MSTPEVPKSYILFKSWITGKHCKKKTFKKNQLGSKYPLL